MRGQKYRSILFIALFLYVGFWVQKLANFQLPILLRDTTTLALGVLYEALPFVLLGTLLSTMLQLYIPSNILTRRLPKNQFLRRFALSLSGSILPVCECGNVPLARGLLAKGLQPSDAFTFLLAAPIINPITILTTSQAFSGTTTVTIARVSGALLIANLVGWLFAARTKQSLISDAFIAYCDAHDHDKPKNAEKYRLWDRMQLFANRFQEEFTTLLPALIAGSFVAGILQTIIPRSLLTTVANEPVVAILSMLLLAFVISICANVDAFFALSLSSIFPVSAIVGFLIFGPMIDIKILSMLRTTFTKQALATLTMVVFVSSAVFALAVHYVA